MHEWALAEAVIATLIDLSKEEGLDEISKIKIKIGELQQIDTEIFKFALDEIAKYKDTGLLRDINIEIETEEAIFRCHICRNEWTFDDISGIDEDRLESIHFAPEVIHAYVRCPQCKSPDFEIIHGRGVLLESIKGISIEKVDNNEDRSDIASMKKYGFYRICIGGKSDISYSTTVIHI